MILYLYATPYEIAKSFIMKILHTSDWHLGKRLESFSRLEEQEAVLDEICNIADREEVQAVIIAGDLYDTFNPPVEAIDLFYKYVKRLANNGNRAVVAIAGNHDSPDRIEVPNPLARECGIIFAGYPGSELRPFRLDTGLELARSEPGFIELIIPAANEPLRIILVPYANELRIKTFLGIDNAEDELRNLLGTQWTGLSEKYCDDLGVNILAAHLLFARDESSIPEEPEEEKPTLYIGGAPAVFTENLPSGICYTALGHLHRKQTVSTKPCPAVYSGSPLAYSFSEANQDKFVVILDAKPGTAAERKDILLTSGRKLVRKRFEDIDTAVAWLGENPDPYVELTIVSDTYLPSDHKKRLHDAHPRIVTIIPESRQTGDFSQDNAATSIDLTKKMEDLFIDYFRYKKAQEPNERILDLFREIIAGEEER